MGNIVLLDDLTINQIAAGEVIERPASVVKELVENSIDAGATNINIEIKNGGISYIRVSDNGKGIPKEDMEIAFERHATSKIRKAEDLENVRSMGFRGEALASIAAIANVEMVSKTEEQDIGYKVVMEAGQVLEKEETGCPQGTTITVNNLFFNTPVRYKFLKKDFTESGYIEDAITRLALVNPHISFKFVNSGKTIIQTTGDGNRKNCIYSIFGKDITNGVIEVNFEYEDIIVEGVIGKPEIARNNRAQQMFFVNNRYVKDKTLSAAIEQAYKGLLTIGKHAFCVLNINLNPNQVDVNVHPSKLEVRFKDENKVFKAIYHTIKENLLNSDLVREPEKEDNLQEEKLEERIENITNNNVPEVKNETRFGSLFKKKIKDEAEFNNPTNEFNLIEQLYYKKNPLDNMIQENPEEYNIDTPEINMVEDASAQENEQIKEQEEIKQEAEQQVETTSEVAEQQAETISVAEEQENVEPQKDFNQMYKETFGREVIKEIRQEVEDNKIVPQYIEKENTISMFENKEANSQKLNYKYIGIAFDTYIILEIDQCIYIVDQHAAHERIMYEKIKENFYSDAEKDSQLMLLPDIITLTHKEMDIVKENTELFRKAGFALEEFGDNTIKLVGVPNICMDLDTKELFMEILDAIDTVAITAIQEKEDKFIATVACKAAVKANMKLDKQEVDSLMDELLKLPNPFTCPHGRPTAIKMSKIDIEKKFSRR